MNKTSSKKRNNFGAFYLFLVISIILHLFLILRFQYLNPQKKASPAGYNVKLTLAGERESPLDKLVSRGRDLMESGRYDMALESYEKALEIDNEDESARLGRGIVYARMGKLDEAMKEFKRLKETNPGNPEGYYGAAMVLAKRDEYKKALVDINKALEIEPYNAQYMSDRGYIWIFTKDLDKAKSDFNGALKINPKNPFANAGLGEVYRRTNDLEKGAYYYEKAIKIDDHIPKTHQFLASIYFDQDRFRESLRYYDLELEKVQKYGRVDDFQEGACYAEMARILAMLDRLDEAEEKMKLFFKSVRKTDLYEAENDEHLSLLSDAGNAYIEMGAHNPKYYNDALFYYKRALDFEKRSSNMKNLYHNFQVGWCYRQLGKPEEAMEYFKRTMEYQPEYFSRYDYWMQGYVLTLLGKYDDALKKYEESLKVDSMFENAYYSRGLTYYLMGENDKAIKDLDMVIKLRKEGNAIKHIYSKALKVRQRINDGRKGTLENIRDL